MATTSAGGSGSTGIKEVKEFFELPPSEFMKEWKALSPEDKEDLRKGIHDGTLTY